MFLRSGNPLPTFPMSYHVWVTSNIRYRRYSKVLIIVSYRFLIFLHYLCFQWQGIHCWHFYWAMTSKTSSTGNLPRFSKSPEHGSSVGLSSMDSWTSKTWIVKKFRKIIKQNHQYLLNRKLTWNFEVTQTWQLSRNVNNGSRILKNMNNEETVKIYKTQSPVSPT